MQKQWSTIVAAIIIALPVAGFAAASHGAQEFTESGSFTVPKGAKTITIEAWGAGGGGGAGFSDGGSFEVPGCGGGGGGYVRKTVNVKAKQVLAVTVGEGGAGGTEPPSTSGQPGGDSTVVAAGVTLVQAGGGAGGGAGNIVIGGSGGLGGSADTAGALVRAGHQGSSASGLSAGEGATPIQGSVEIELFYTSTFSQATAAGGGYGGRATPSGPFTRAGTQGGRGHVLMTW
ncbi:MAG: glycine-rich domain-containing protein [Candidatus Sumerlaeaceae bacterium]